MSAPDVNPLVEFLKARLDEDEQTARATGGGAWHNGEPATIHHDPTVYRTVVDPGRVGLGDHVCGSILAADAEHIARHDPARVLAEVEAKRRIVELHGEGAPGCCLECGDSCVPLPCPTLRLLARLYAGHPGYRVEWAP